MRLPGQVDIAQRDTHRLIPARHLEEPTVLARIADSNAHLEDLFELDSATNDRLLAQDDRLPGIGRDELVFVIPNFSVVNASFTHAGPDGGRFNLADRGAWYAGFELATSLAEVLYHKSLHYREINWNEHEETRYQDMLADFTASFHDCRSDGWEHALAPDSYAASQHLAASLLASGSAGVVYPSVRMQGGTCIACFRPALVNNVRRGACPVLCWNGLGETPFWRSAPAA